MNHQRRNSITEMTVLQTRYIYISSIFLFFHDSMTNTAILGNYNTWIRTKVFLVIKKIRWIFPIRQKHLAPAAFRGPVLIGCSNPSIVVRNGCDGHALVVPALIKLPFYDILVLIGKICLSLVTKGQIISEQKCGVLNFPKMKRNYC